mmetsp:Transcript_25357/g.74911  ORF Transcript_25357/g.74911 Transcript_25357/m.74911 type:complete len:424 (-) Transcript_25357:105-1376(-)
MAYERPNQQAKAVPHEGLPHVNNKKQAQGTILMMAQHLGSATERLRPFMGPVTAVLYGALACSMTFLNKYAMMIFPLPNTIMLLQMVVSAALLEALLQARFFNFKSFYWARCKQLLLITLLYSLNAALALFGLKTLNVPMYTTLKRLTPFIILIVKAVTVRKWPPLQVSASVLVVVAGCLIAGMGDLTFEVWGYVMALASCVAQAGYLLLVEFQGAGGIPTSELLYYTAWSSLPMLASLAIISGEASMVRPVFTLAVQTHGHIPVASTIGSCCALGCALNYALFLCTTNNSALTTTIVGVLKSVVAVVLGFFLLGGVPFSMINVMGISLNLVGGIWYTAYKFREKSSTTRAVAASLSNDALKNASLPQVAKQPDHIMSPGTQTAPGSSKILERSLDDQMPPLPRSTARDILMGVHTAREKYPI